jgi:lysophospholipase L1-like esterase
MRLQRLRKAFLALLFPLLIISILFNVYLYSQFRKYYTWLYAIELDPLGLEYFQENTNQPQIDPSLLTVVFLGDSRAAQWPSPIMEGFQFINRGIGNQTSAQVAGRFGKQIAPLEPDIVILQFCINDLKTIPLFPGRGQQIVQNCESHLQEIVQDSLARNSTVVISTVFPSGNVPIERRLNWSDDIEHARQQVNYFIRSLSSERVIILDAENVLADRNGKIKAEYSLDTLHLNEAGYQALNQKLIQILDGIRHRQK